LSRRAWLAGLALLLTACATAVVPVAPSVVFDTAKSPRLPARLKYGLFVTTARLDDVEHGPFVLDTGAFALTLDTRLADRLGVTRPGHTVIRQLVRFGTVGAIEIGPVVFRRAEVSIVDLSAPAKTFGETLAGEVSSAGIDVNSVAPGPLNTRLLQEVLDAGPEKVGTAFYEASLKQRESGGAPLEVGAGLCVYLASDESSWVTGAAMPVDGGYLAV